VLDVVVDGRDLPLDAQQGRLRRLATSGGYLFAPAI